MLAWGEMLGLAIGVGDWERSGLGLCNVIITRYLSINETGYLG